uniref:Glutaminyl-peptide cyclotransferase n=1 Tax=Ananas comosus var. bracteatus TaxID=296719 RepID=A0A6V7NPZ8_ANACO|nr:unnamed protein product [Ananas comosus var. bracteatus]
MAPPPPPPRFKTTSSSSSRYRSYFRGVASLPSALVVVSFLLLLLLPVLLFGLPWRRGNPTPARFYSFDVVNEFPHDPGAFTQGLLYGGNDTLFESTGLYARSSVREVLLKTGKVQAYHAMDGSLFGEGLTLLGERLFQVTWLRKTGFIYDRYNFSNREEFTHDMRDGWGLATDGKVLFGSDGSSTLYQLATRTLRAIKSVTVRYKDREIPFLNELEYVNGEVWANIWMTDCIARISHKDGLVVGWILLHELRQRLLQSGHTAIDVLNGIAWDKDMNRLFVTGKLWPKLYEIKLRPITDPSNGRIENLCPIGA